MKGIFILLSLMLLLCSLIKSAYAEEEIDLSKGMVSFNYPFSAKRALKLVQPSQRLQLTLQNLQHAKTPYSKEQSYTSWREFKNQLKALVAVQFSNQVQLGFDSIKVQALNPKDSDILDINMHLSGKPSGESISSRGYGLELRVKLD